MICFMAKMCPESFVFLITRLKPILFNQGLKTPLYRDQKSLRLNTEQDKSEECMGQNYLGNKK